ncbi:hypothetical protein LTR86_007633 [Recurvomyces mirabilis]|nr:hypothetical protein LTR86_007633 [Recurvomyces mirabilis]
MIGWTAVLFAIQGWLSETPAQKAASSTPSYFSVGMSILSLGTAYMPLFMPPAPAGKGAAGTSAQPPPPVPN